MGTIQAFTLWGEGQFWPLSLVGGSRQRGITQVHLPFFMSNISQCREKFDQFSENPEKFWDEFVKLSLVFSLTWQDVIVLLIHCCFLDKKACILGKA